MDTPNTSATLQEVSYDTTVLPHGGNRIAPVSLTCGFSTFFEGKYIVITGINQYFVQHIHNWLHAFGSLYEYHKDCDVVVIVGKYALDYRLKRLQKQYPNATYIEFNRELSDFVNCKYESVITVHKRERYISSKSASEKSLKGKPTTSNLTKKIILGILTVAIAIAIIYFGLGIFILLMIFVPGVAEALLKGLIG